MKCVCGLDHSYPVPDVFKEPPIVYAFFYYDGTAKKEAVCHACGKSGPQTAAFFTDPDMHEPDCKWIKSLEENPAETKG